MAENIADGNLFVYHLTTIANVTAPTTTEITAGTKLSAEMKVDDLDISFTENEFDNSNAESAFQATGVGTYGASMSITLDDNDDKVLFDLLSRGLKGFIVVSRHGAPVAADIVEVYPTECHGSKPMNTPSNEKVKFSARFAITSAPTLDAEVAAGGGG